MKLAKQKKKKSNVLNFLSFLQTKQIYTSNFKI